MCAFISGMTIGLGGVLPMLVVFSVVVFLIRAVWSIFPLSFPFACSLFSSLLFA
ncbi:conserved domain protein [Bacteroides fluxus YIT 12057]|uniref:Conserved domain protein n=1 Tax=Bacteroides fluxus YIT 12057 TaxID=763034 RepID=F3PP79_9BACE|nr:conserved domain protein [Bacteroides fluxus YIT 12057]